MIGQMLSNWVCWAILGLAFACYHLLWTEYLALKRDDAHRIEPEHSQVALTGILIGALPLLGLLGTITGLLACFDGIARHGADGAMLSGEIADALLTTQLGLVCAIPGWLLQTRVRSLSRERGMLAAG